MKPPKSPRKAQAEPTRDARKEATQARILDAARMHFERDGFDGANIRAIANDAQVATGTVLLHFTDKAGLLHAALHADLEDAIARCLAVTAQGPLLERLSAVAGHFYSYYAARPQLSRTLLRESLFAAEPWHGKFAYQVNKVNVHVATLIAQAQEHGEIAQTTNVGLLSGAFLSLYYAALIGWVQGGVEQPLALFEALMGQHIQGVKA